MAFLAQPLLPEPIQLALGHISTILALLVGGAWGMVTKVLLKKPMSKKQAITIWEARKPYLTHPTGYPMTATLAK